MSTEEKNEGRKKPSKRSTYIILNMTDEDWEVDDVVVTGKVEKPTEVKFPEASDHGNPPLEFSPFWKNHVTHLKVARFVSAMLGLPVTITGSVAMHLHGVRGMPRPKSENSTQITAKLGDLDLLISHNAMTSEHHALLLRLQEMYPVKKRAQDEPGKEGYPPGTYSIFIDGLKVDLMVTLDLTVEEGSAIPLGYNVYLSPIWATVAAKVGYGRPKDLVQLMSWSETIMNEDMKKTFIPRS